MAEIIKSKQKKFLRELNQVILDRTTAFDGKLDKIVKLIIGFKHDSIKFKAKVDGDAILPQSKKTSPMDDPRFAEDFKVFREAAPSQIGPDANAHFDLGIAYKEMGLIEESIKSFQEAQKTGADPVQCLQMISQVYEEDGDIEKAIKFTKEAKVAHKSKGNHTQEDKTRLGKMNKRIRDLGSKLVK